MKILLHYLSRYKGLVLLSFLLAALNTGFSLLDPVFFGKLFDYIKENYNHIQQHEYILNVMKFIGIMIGVAMASRIAKAFQDYTVNTVIQRFGADVYTDGLKRALQLPYQQFEDQRSGETLAVLEKVRIDSEKFMTLFINVLFGVFVSVVFVMIYSFTTYPKLVLIYMIGAVLLSALMSVLSKKIKFIQRTIIKETTALAGATTESLRNIELIRSLGLTNQEIKRLNLTTRKILQLELKKVKSIRSLSFVQGTFVNLMRQSILFVLAYLVFKDHLSIGQMITMQFFSFFIFGPLQELGNIILAYREAETSLSNFEKLMHTPVEARPLNPKPINK